MRVPKQFRDTSAHGVALMEHFDGLSDLRRGLTRLAKDRDEWAGLPMPLDGQRLVIEPTYKYAALSEINKEKEDPSLPPLKIRNVFWSHAKHCRIAIAEEEDGRIWHTPLTGSANGATFILQTLGASDAWGIEQESKAVELLCHLVGHRKFKQYMLTGTFLETSKRSGVTYVFRRLRPTIALTNRHPSGFTRILCCLCMHPIGYYAESWAGCMCPTDDVIAHLMLMRADEKMFWKRCAQHEAHDPASGL